MTKKDTFNLKDLASLYPHNIGWHNFFGNDNPIDLEIGCGRPHFFFDRVNNFPERNIVGVEWKYEFANQARRRILREGHNNAHSLHGNAWLLVPLLFEKQSIDHILVNFPDPWWKARHKKRLVLNDIFLSALHMRSTDQGLIILQTDVRELFDFYCEILRDHKGFMLDDSLSESDIFDLCRARTHREKKCMADGLPIYRGVFRRNKSFA